MERRTKIVATLGPSSCSEATLRQLIDAGLDVARLNASHGDHQFFSQMVEMVRALGAEAGKVVAILLDLRGPKIRVGKLAGGKPVALRTGNKLRITSDEIEGTSERIPSTYAGLMTDVHEGDRILLDDGLIELRVAKLVSESEIECEVLFGGLLNPNKGINVPGRALSTAAFDAKDLEDLGSAIELGVDYVALSFVRCAEDVRSLRREIHSRGSTLPIISKIEKPQAIEHLEDIMQASDGIMVARGDLGVEVPPERVPSLQKTIIQMANDYGLPVITATQMLESMINHPRPTRAEASDVANAIFDGTDAVMLSGETASGAYPVEAVRMMVRIALEAEDTRFYDTKEASLSPVLGCDPSLRALAQAARWIARHVDARYIAAYTLSGTTAKVMSKLRPGRSILALCPDEGTSCRLVLYHGVIPMHCSYHESADDMLGEGDRILLEKGMVKAGDKIVVLSGTKQFGGISNMVQLRQLTRGGKER